MFSPTVQNAISRIVEYGFTTLDAINSIAPEAVEYRIQNAYLNDSDKDEEAQFEGWIDYAESQGWDPEEIDIALGLC